MLHAGLFAAVATLGLSMGTEWPWPALRGNRMPVDPLQSLVSLLKVAPLDGARGDDFLLDPHPIQRDVENGLFLHRSAPGLSRRCASLARSPAALRAYLCTICAERHPASCIKSPSVPPFKSHAWAKP